MRSIQRLNYVLTLLATTCITLGAAADEGVILHLPLDGESRQIYDANGKQAGWHNVAWIADHDDPASTNPARYRLLGRYGKGIRYFVDSQSYSVIEAYKQAAPLEELAISMEVKVASASETNFASLISNRSFSDKGGFALFMWGGELRFYFGDGQTRHQLNGPIGKLRDGEWHTVEVSFERGKAGMWIDGAPTVSKDVEGKVIAPATQELYLGSHKINNPKERRQYAFDGMLDEVAIGTHREPLRKYLDEKNLHRSNEGLAAPLEFTAQPIDGNEPHFGGKKMFHTFRGMPVPLTFLFKSRPNVLKEGDKPSLVVYVPEGVRVVSVHQSAHSLRGGNVRTDTTTVEKDNKTWTRHQTRDIDLMKGGPDWGAGNRISWGFDAGEDVTECPIRYGLVYGGEEHELTEATLKFLPPPPATSAENRGRFHIFSYYMNPTFCYPQTDLQDAVAELLLSVGYSGKGRFYDHGDYRAQWDERMKTKGFTLYEIGMWNGPSVHKMALDAQGATEAYVEAIAGHLRPNGPNEGVIFDYEPWRVPYMDESFKPEIRAAFAKWAKLDHTPEAAELKGKLKRQWTDFWLDAGMSAYAAMAKAVRTHHPDPKTLLIAYTYFYDYGDEEKMYNQYWSCPKDPKLAERLYDVNLMGCYTKHDRELYDKVTLARKHLTKPMWAISSVSRVNPIQERYTKPYDSLSPQRLEQKIVQCAALGMERHGVWPGTGWIDGMHLAAMGNASRFIWAHEAFYFDGKRADDQLTVTPKAAFKEWCSTAHESGGRIMVTVFNFTDQSREFIIRARGAGETQTCKVAPRAYEAVMLER